MLEVRHISVSVARPWREAYEDIWRPDRFPAWAEGLSKADLRREGDTWVATGSDGPIRIDFTGHNDFGVMDHTVHLGSGEDVFVPLRIVANGTGCEITLTLFRQPGMTDAVFARDAGWVERDLGALKWLLETGGLGDRPHDRSHKGGGMD